MANTEIKQFIFQQKIKALKIRAMAATTGTQTAQHNIDYFTRRKDANRLRLHLHKKKLWQAESAAAAEELAEAKRIHQLLLDE